MHVGSESSAGDFSKVCTKRLSRHVFSGGSLEATGRTIDRAWPSGMPYWSRAGGGTVSLAGPYIKLAYIYPHVGRSTVMVVSSLNQVPLNIAHSLTGLG